MDYWTSGVDGISGCPSMLHLLVGTFFEFGVVENFVFFRDRIAVIYFLQIHSAVSYDYGLGYYFRFYPSS